MKKPQISLLERGGKNGEKVAKEELESFAGLGEEWGKGCSDSNTLADLGKGGRTERPLHLSSQQQKEREMFEGR